MRGTICPSDAGVNGFAFERPRGEESGRAGHGRRRKFDRGVQVAGHSSHRKVYSDTVESAGETGGSPR